ncbi:hypothetical protein [Sphingobacterium sp. SYP-B4668]|uniref:hypothetical protein n=1 Tax=Sphingobacterium sp. SYP-B4668 TaxID=2996035 RepID=UPI0022DE9371|nr:hypothetical protein [Sphingobacterium sp. SYP-B4668]
MEYVHAKKQSNPYLKTLNLVLEQQEKWVKVHAAEFLLWSGADTTLVAQTYRLEEKQHAGLSPYRIGIWRVLYQASTTPSDKKMYLDKIMTAFREGPDHLHALETLAKLKIPITNSITAHGAEVLKDQEVTPMYLYGLWNMYYDEGISKDVIVDKLLTVLIDPTLSSNLRIVACYILRYLPLTTAIKDTLIVLPYQEWGEDVQLQFLCTLLTLGVDEQQVRDKVVRDLLFFDTKPDALPTIMLGLSNIKEDWIWNKMETFYKQLSDIQSPHYNPDFLATGAYAMLKFIN